MLVELCNGQLVLIKDCCFDATVVISLQEPRGVTRVTRPHSMGHDLTEGEDYWLFPATNEGYDAALEKAIEAGITNLDKLMVQPKHWQDGRLLPCTCVCAVSSVNV